jgi:hypothetical protein
MYPPPMKSTEETPAVAFAEQAQQYNRKLQGYLDRITPYSTYRWIATGVLLVLFSLRVVYGQGVSLAPTCHLDPEHIHSELTLRPPSVLCSLFDASYDAMVSGTSVSIISWLVQCL